MGKELFPNLRKVVGLLLSLPHSNASVERIFSYLKRIKTTERNSLKTDSSILTTKDALKDLGGVLNFVPRPKMLNSNNWNISLN